ncbi:ATP-binding cassette domain-containing protein [Aquibium sp. A9E412]|uniref:ATP-binding cassette domain-containing protein n=1 Tax=Aquibium sp. A9E412 TaxID=2976767 RepID=UPI0025B1085B|nr:ATP-binding cassette domain-containing protein [Aquibium sp. A9E412]MDN2564624.1 ATP-binding cassette domain-containing protein [Aquibium sp. A9E412]
MKIEGSVSVDAPADEVWTALFDPAVMNSCIPGATDIERVSPTTYRGKVGIKIGPIAPSFDVVVEIDETTENESVSATIRGEEGSRASMVNANALMTLEPLTAEQTELRYSTTVSVTGRLGKFGLGIMKKTAEKQARQFAEALSRRLSEAQPDDRGEQEQTPEPHRVRTRSASQPPAPSDLACSLENISFEYALPGGKTLPVIEDVSFDLRRGEVVTILGPSGCGKSTLLHIAAGLLPCKSGRITIDGENIIGRPGKTGLMMQSDELLPWRTVLENVLLGPEVLKGGTTKADSMRALELLEIAGLLNFEHHYPNALSGGMRQRVAFVRTLMLDRPLVLLDEPFGALDAITRGEMQQWLLEMRAQLDQTLLLITHDVDEAIFLSDRIMVMSSRPGRIALERASEFDRPRNFEEIVVDPRFGALKRDLLKAIHPRNSSR